MRASFTQPPASQLTRRLALPIGVIELSMMGFLTCAVGTDRDRNPLVGTWHLVRYIDTPEGSAPIQAFGTEPIGLFILRRTATSLSASCAIRPTSPLRSLIRILRPAFLAGTARISARTR
jgi:hypothetical protein